VRPQLADGRISVTCDPKLITFDILGTVLDWRTGLEASCRSACRPLPEGEFDRIIDVQGELERGDFVDYTEITRRSLVDVIGLPNVTANEIAAGLGRWPLYSDAPVLRALMEVAPCAATTNSDRIHGEDVQAQLGFRLDDWLCAEDTHVYKPHLTPTGNTEITKCIQRCPHAHRATLIGIDRNG
jgi:FMN phosphatase YigB (HAD superfamily)